MNKVILMGNLTKDVELRQTQTGKSVGSVGLATNESYIDAYGNKQNKAEFHNLVIWGKQAESLAKYTHKGSKVLVEGKITYSDYLDKEGVKKYKTEIVVLSFRFLDSVDSNKEQFVKKEDGSLGVEEQEEVQVKDIPF